MFRQLTSAFVAFLVSTCAAVAAFVSFGLYNTSISVIFTPLHTYYMAASGCNDSNAGTSSGSPWCTVNHPVVCGDVIIAAAGTYNGFFNAWGTVISCPSTSGGIDGTGGVYFAILLCGGSDLGTNGCNINCATGQCAAGAGGTKAAMDIASNNWAIEGWTIAGDGTVARGFQSDACASGTTIIHHHAFINDIVSNANLGEGTDDCALNHNSPGNGVDYWAVVGDVAQNAAQDTICLAAIDSTAPAVYDTNAGTHVYIYGDFSYANVNTPCRSISDTESYMFDTWDAHNYGNQGVIANNIGYDSDRECIQMTQQNFFSPTPIIKIYNNTCFQNDTNTGGNFMDGEINLGLITSTTFSWVFTIINNIAYQPLATSTGGGVAAFVVNPITSFTIGGSGTQNFFRANNSSCLGTSCNSTFDAEQFHGTSALLGTNTYTNPAYTNTADLLANQIGVPNCSGFTTTTACMGWNAINNTLTTPSIISDLIPTAGGTTGKGYQLTSITCATNVDYPTWLKGVVYLHWNGINVIETGGLVTKPCGM